MVKHDLPYPIIPPDTQRAARPGLNLGNPYRAIGDQLEDLLLSCDLSALEPDRGQPLSVVTLNTIITIIQFAERMPDRLAIEATRTRLDWKYALHLPLHYPGVQPDSLCRYRQRLKLNPGGQEAFERLTRRIGAMGLLNRRMASDPQATSMIRTICAATRLDLVAQAFNQALEALASQQPERLRLIALPHWYQRYDGFSLAERFPNSEIDQAALARALGADAHHLLSSMGDLDSGEQKTIPEIRNLHRVYHEQYYSTDPQTGTKATLQWRQDQCSGCIWASADPGQPNYTEI